MTTTSLSAVVVYDLSVVGWHGISCDFSNSVNCYLEEFWANAQFMRQTEAGQRETHPGSPGE